MIEKYMTVMHEAQEQIIQKKSKFICYITQVNTEEEVLSYIQTLKKKYYDATHHCYAYIIGLEEHPLERFSDDREPSGTAGKPILEVLKGAGLKNVVAVVIRYFGGTLLGTGGLIKAYTDSVKAALDNSRIYENIYSEKIALEIDYSLLPKFNHYLHKDNQKIYDTIFNENVTLILFLPLNRSEDFKKAFVELSSGQCKILSQGFFYVAVLENDIIVNNLP